MYKIGTIFLKHRESTNCALKHERKNVSSAGIKTMRRFSIDAMPVAGVSLITVKGLATHSSKSADTVKTGWTNMADASCRSRQGPMGNIGSRAL